MKKKAILAALVLGFTMSLQPFDFTNSLYINTQDKSADNLVKAENWDTYLYICLEGPFNVTDMNMDIFDNGLLPVGQPYNVPPWNYDGTETLQVSPGADVVDWVLLEFRRTLYGPASATPETMVHRCAALLMSDGTIANVGGYSPLQIQITKENVFIVIHHRNHLSVMSNTPLIPWSPQGYGYDFRDQLSKAYLDGHKEIGLGVYGMISGDCDANGIIELNDKEVCWTPEAGHTGYLPGDWNLDLQVNNPDKDDIWIVNMGLESKVPKEFVCGELLTDFRDDQTYATVLIGEQCWMAENLNIGTRIDAVITQTNNETIEKYCFDDLENNCDVYGGMYQWYEMMNYTTIEEGQGICPAGWHIPSDNNWSSLVNFLGGVSIAGGKMKETGTLHWLSPNVGATNESGFTALPGGRTAGDVFLSLKTHGYFYTSTDYNPDRAWYWLLHHNYTIAQHYDADKGGGFSVRCIKSNLPPNSPTNPSPVNGAIDQSSSVYLSWSCTDPENDLLTFDLYFGTELDPPLLQYGLSEFIYQVNNLICDTTYNWKIIAFDYQNNITEGPIWSFSTKSFWECGCSAIDDRDGQIYKTMLIGDQCWMAENLNIGTRIDGINDQLDNGLIDKYCYADIEDSCTYYGGLYQWDEAMQYSTTPGAQGICPDGWYIPTDEEWKQLEGWTDSQYGYPDPEWNNLYWRGWDAGYNLKSLIGWSSGGNGSDFYGFTALPGGYRFNYPDYFTFSGNLGFFWTSDEDIGSNSGWRRMFSFDNNGADRDLSPKESGFSVRCLKVNIPPDMPSNPTPNNGAINQPTTLTLTWSCADPEKDPLTYDVYFGMGNNPPLIISDISDTTFVPGVLYEGFKYYWKIVARDNHQNITTGSRWSFTTQFNCGEYLVDLRDGQTYTSVLIGEQCWMAENLNIGTRIDGINDQTDNSTIEKYCYNNIEDSCNVYGGLYQWNEMMQYTYSMGIQGICPEGWHIPSNNEYIILADYLGGMWVAGGKMKEAGYSHWSSPNTGATNESGFTGLPGGYCYNSSYSSMHYGGLFWTTTILGSLSRFRSLSFWFDDLISNGYEEIYGLSVRCIQGYINQPPSQPQYPVPESGSNHISVDTLLGWSCFDPEGDNMQFAICLDTINPPGLFETGFTDTLYDPGTLNFSTTYYWKIIAYDTYGDSTESNVWNFTTEWGCGSPIIDDRDGQSYNTVLIANQCWMAENINIGTITPGEDDQLENGIIEKYCYLNDENYCNTYGGLYQWNEMMQYITTEGTQGICPDGWHIPTNDEWAILTDTLGGLDFAGGKMKSTGTIQAGTGLWEHPNTGATNLSGFTGQPGGWRLSNVGPPIFSVKGYMAYFWSSTQDYINHAWTKSLSYQYESVESGYVSKFRGFSVRCTKN